MDKFKRYDIELGDDGFWNNCLVVDESYNGDWVRYSEVRDEIEKLESEKVELLKTLNDAREFVQYYAEEGFPDAIELDKQILGIIVAKSKGQQ